MSRMSDSPDDPAAAVIRDHRRQWRDCRYVYPVISRRARGLSVGVNLNPDKRCTFSCRYCQINRTLSRNLADVDLARLGEELAAALDEAASGRLWGEPRFAAMPEEMRRINDIAFSGDGEPTCLPAFDEAVSAAAQAKAAASLDEVKIVVITNASRLESPQVARALPILDANNGEIWAKLDAGTEDYFQQVNRPQPGLTLNEIVSAVAAVARGRPIVIQTLFLRLEGAAPPPEEIEAYCRQLHRILDSGGRIRLVQIHTIARSPADAAVSALPDEQLDAIAAVVRTEVRDVHVETYYGADVPPQGGGQSARSPRPEEPGK